MVPDGDQAPGVESDEYRVGLKRKVADISRSQYEVYSFATKHNLSEAAVDGDAKQCMYLIMCCIEKSSWNPSARINVH